MSVKLLSNLDFAAKLNSVEAVTESGKEFLKNYRGYMYQNAASCGIVNGFIQESQNYGYDTGIMTILESILKYVNENNISWKLASACESVANNNSSYNYIAKLGVKQVEKLLEMNEAEVVQYIKGGCLKNVQYIPEFRNVCKEVFNSTISETHAPTYNVTTPYSYVVIDENAQYFSVLGTTYKISEGNVEVSNIEDATFNRVNSLLPNFKMVDENLTFEYKANYSAEPYKFSINENEITFSKGNINEKFDSSANFRQYADGYSRQLYMTEKFNFINTCNSIAEVFENMDQIVMIDCAKVMECADSTVLSIVEAENAVNVNVARSIHSGSSCNNFSLMTEALAQVEKVTGNDIKSLYETRINEEMKNQDPEGYQKIQEELAAAKDAQMSDRRKKIAMLAEQFKNDPVKIALLNNVAKELAILEGAE
jgi:hypothetical protein